MVNHRCFFSNCENGPAYICTCCSSETYMCKFHMGFHWTNTASHSFKPIFSLPNPAAKSLILSKLNKEKLKVDKLKSKVLKKFTFGYSCLYNLMTNIFNVINKDAKEVHESINKINSTTEISKYETNKLLKSLLLSAENAGKVTDLPKFKANPNIEAACSIMLNISKILEQLSKKLLDPDAGDIIQEFQDALNGFETNVFSKEEEALMIQQLHARLEKLLSYEEMIKKAKENYLANFELPVNLQNLKFLIKQCGPDINKENYKALIEVNSEAKELYELLEKSYETLTQELAAMTDQLAFDSGYLYSIKRDKTIQQNIMLKYSIENKAFERKNLDNELLDKGTAIIQLPNSELFCYGNYSCTGYSCIINLKTLEIKELPEGYPCSSAGIAYYNKCVYAFGGCSQKKSWSSQACKFELTGYKWNKLPTLAVSYSCNCSCAVFENNILLCSEGRTDIVKYEIDRNSYTIVANISSLSKGKKLLFAADSRVFLLESKGNIFESKDGNNWKQIESSAFGNHNCSFSVYNHKFQSIFLCLNSRQVHCYEFNLHKKHLVKLTSTY
ncbi:unnamed protein product [Blepharisma stoltei]|uniref:Uncharacterized protein n=1 Tax=Blepharisma stoltei TaxID=1481888 RepID=A0AAU9K9A4_9CILI|nr:unnamed protein product [Blepharisma stoltei]